METDRLIDGGKWGIRPRPGAELEYDLWCTACGWKNTWSPQEAYPPPDCPACQKIVLGNTTDPVDRNGCQKPDSCEAFLNEDGVWELQVALESASSPLGGQALSMAFVFIPVGRFTMGTPLDELGRSEEELAPHEVVIGRPFWMTKYPVTKAQLVAVVGSSSRFEPPNTPARWLTPLVIDEFILKLMDCVGNGSRFRLPSEAEWEYACRAGTTTPFSFGNDTTMALEFGWFSESNRLEPFNAIPEVGQRKPNAWGLYDMHGLVWEWVRDGFLVAFRGDDPPVIVKGGSFWDRCVHARSGARMTAFSPQDGCWGMRIVMPSKAG